MKWSKALAKIAIVLLGAGISLIDSYSILPTLCFVGSGIPFALSAFFLEKKSFYYKRKAKKDDEKAYKQKQRKVDAMFNQFII